MNNSHPIEVQAAWLYDQRDGPQPPPGYQWSCLQCIQVQPSTCGYYLAVKLRGVQSRPAPDNIGLGDAIAVYDMVMYAVSEGIEEQARFYTGVWQPTTRWSASGHFCVAQLLKTAMEDEPECQAYGSGLLQELSMQSAAFIWEPSTATVLHSLSSEASSVIRTLGRGCRVYPTWSPSCRYLLVLGEKFEPFRMDQQRQGWLLIADVAHASIAAQSTFTSVAKDSSLVPSSVVWHPSSQGLIFTNDIQVKDVAPFLQAGYAFGALPDQLHMHTAGFCADATYLIAKSRRSTPMSGFNQVVLVRCTMAGLHICLEEAHPLVLPDSPNLDQARYEGWIMDRSILFMSRRLCKRSLAPSSYGIGSSPSRYERLLFSIGAPGRAHPLDPYLYRPHTISPSGRFVFTRCSLLMEIANVQTGQQCWDSATSHPRWPELSESEVCAIQRGSQASHRDYEFSCWLPTGIGFICSACQCTSCPDTIPPALHFYRYA